MDRQSYTITDDPVYYYPRPFSVTPRECRPTYSFTLSDFAAASTISLDPQTSKFTFYNVDDLNAAGSMVMFYEVTLVATYENVQSEATFVLAINNPC